jgi:DNA polymerase-3 subunit epsilon
MRRWWWRRRIDGGALASLLDAAPPSAAAGVAETEFVCLDIETNSLDAASADILSIGWVEIRRACIDLGSAEAHLVRPRAGVGASATVHGLTDSVCATGQPVRAVMERLLDRLPGRALVVHHAALDKAVLDRVCAADFGGPLLVPVVDTLELELRRRRRRHHLADAGALRLGELRANYNLPRYRSHDCLSDALATAELFIAMMAIHDTRGRLRLADIAR